jgi:hypothetical protein
MKLPDLIIIKDLQELRSFITEKYLFSISAPLQVGSEFILALCSGTENSDSVCLYFPVQQVAAVADILFSDHTRRVYVHALKEIMVWFKRQGVELYAEMFMDVSLAACLLEPPVPDRGEDWRKFLLSSLVKEHLKEPYPFVYKRVLERDFPEVFYGQLIQDARYVWRLGLFW